MSMKYATKDALVRHINTMVWFNALPFVIVTARVEHCLRSSRGFVPIYHYGHGLAPIRPGEIGLYEGKRYFTAEGKPEKAR